MAERGTSGSTVALAGVVAGVVVAAALLVGAVPAAAEEVSDEQFRGLVERAGSDDAAVDRLRGVDRVDGRPVDVRGALDGATGDELRARLDALGTGSAPAAPGTGADGARASARRILDGRKFDESPVPRPFRGALRRLGGWLRPVAEPVGRGWDRISGNPFAVGLLAAAVVGTAALVAAGVIRRRTRAGVERAGKGRGWGAEPGDDPDELERRASVAERDGDLNTALRLRFKAGVVRLDRAGVIADRPALTSGELSRRLASFPVGELTAAFEEVAYGGRAATSGDLDAARTGWRRVLHEAAAR